MEKTLEELLVENQQLTKDGVESAAKVVALTADLAAAETVISELKDKLKAETATKETKETKAKKVKHEGVSYEVVLPIFNVEGVIYTAEDLATNKELVKKLVEQESGVLKKLA